MKGFLTKFLVAIVAVAIGVGGLGFAQFLLSIDEAIYGWSLGIVAGLLMVGGVFPLFMAIIRFCISLLGDAWLRLAADFRSWREQRLATHIAKAEARTARIDPAVADVTIVGSGSQGLWFWIVDGVMQGPADVASLQNWILDGMLDFETLLWKEGSPAWLPAKEIPEFAPLFTSLPSETEQTGAGNVPPPLPET